MKGLFIKSALILISISIVDNLNYGNYQIELGVVDFSKMRVDYIFIGPGVGFNDMSKVIFLSDSRFYYQTYATNLYFSNDPFSSKVTLDNLNRLKGIIYSSE